MQKEKNGDIEIYVDGQADQPHKEYSNLCFILFYSALTPPSQNTS